MGRRIGIYWVFPLMVVLAGCGGGGMGGLFQSRTAPSAVQSDAIKPLDMGAIQTQTLAPVPQGGAPAATGGATGRVVGAPTAAAPASVATPAVPTSPPAPQSAADIGAAAAAALKAGASASTAAATATNSTAPAPQVANPPSPEQATCVAEGGRWGRAGDSGAMSCFRPATDAGKSCSKEDDCASQCLARSRTCAPFWPIFGCTEVIQNNGAVVNLCLE